MNNYAPPLQGTANNLAQYGRYGDSMLVHMNPAEVDGIASLSPTGRLTINPVTGQPEAFLPFLAPLIGGALGSAALTGAGAGILGSAGLSAAAAGAIGSGLASWAESGDIKEGLMSGLTGYGIGKAFGALGAGGKAAAEGARQANLPPPLWTDATQGLIEKGAAAAADPAAASLYQETTKGLGGMGERLSLMKSQRGELIPNLMQQAPLMATGEMGRSQLQATKELEEGIAGLGEDDEENLQRQYDILGGAWNQLEKDYPYPVQPYPRYAAGGGKVQNFQAGGILGSGQFPKLGPESAAARQASIRGSVFVPAPDVNEAGQPWRAGFDPEHNYFGSPVSTVPPGIPEDDIAYLLGGAQGQSPVVQQRTGYYGDREVARMPRRFDYEKEGGAGEYRADLREWKEAHPSKGYQEGGIVDLAANDQAMMAEQPVDPAMQAEMMPDPAMQAEMMPDPAMQQEEQMADELIQQTILAILGRVDDPDVIIDMFIDQFGQEAYLALRDEVLNTVVPGAQTEGLIEGQGDGMSDEVMGMIGDQQEVATSPGEYIVPADVVSGIGNGSSDSGASQLDGMIDQIRQARTGTEVQPEAINPEELMPV